jgi:site-specific recombinase XerD
MSGISKFSLFKRSNGFYYILFELDGRRRWKTTNATLKTDALRALANFQNLLKEKPKAVTLASFCQDFLTHSRSTLAARTVIIHRQSLERLLSLVGNCSLASLSPKHLDNYVTQRVSSGISPVTVNIEIRAIKAAFNTAVRWKILEGNPFAAMKQLRVPERQPAFFTKSDFEKLMALLSEGWLRELVVFSVATGMRQNEVLNLTWRDVDLERKLIHIQSSATFNTKQGKRRTIPMSDGIYSLLAGKAGRTTQEYVFIRHGRRIGDSFLTHSFKRKLRQAKLDEALHWHSLRHTHASWLVQDGVSLYEVQRLLGHSSSRVTEVYSHLQPEQLHNTVNRLQIALI